MKPPSLSKSPESSLRRARPLLGTLVEVQASGLAPVAQVERAVESAFAAITRVQTAMSFHDPASDLSRINRLAARRPVQVASSTWTVLRHALALALASDGRFDPTIAPVLQRWGLLPNLPNVGAALRRDDARSAPAPSNAPSSAQSRRKAAPTPKPTANWQAIRLLSGRRVRFLAPITVDLGGIAKGYAVDRAIAALRRAGATSGLVNAGGDLRVFGAEAAPVHVRHPKQPGSFFTLGELHDGALATSALTFSGTTSPSGGRVIGALVDPRSGTACGHGVSITVLARTTWLADALTKVVAVDSCTDPTTATALLLKRYRARAVVLDTEGRAVWLNATVPLPHVA